jgi:23S rRNA pseudouridine2457 synthase
VPLIFLNKPFQVLSQFTDPDGRATLADFISAPGVYPAGRLDYDSEGLMLLTDDGRLQARISQPRSQFAKVYRAQVEGHADKTHVERLLKGCQLKDGPARALSATLIDEPAALWPRQPPIRERKSIPTSWIEIAIDEGRNRQVRRMTAAVGLPTLRLIRYGVGPWALDDLKPGESRSITDAEAWNQIKS